MKKNKLLFIITLLLGFFCTQSSFAQFSAGGGLGFETETDRLGFFFKVRYQVDELWGASPSYNIYPSTGDNLTVLDLDANYNLFTIGVNEIPVYGIGGIGIASISNSTKLGLNLGIGTIIPSVSNLDFFGEIKFRVNKFSNTHIGGGVLYRFGI